MKISSIADEAASKWLHGKLALEEACQWGIDSALRELKAETQKHIHLQLDAEAECVKQAKELGELRKEKVWRTESMKDSRAFEEAAYDLAKTLGYENNDDGCPLYFISKELSSLRQRLAEAEKALTDVLLITPSNRARSAIRKVLSAISASQTHE